MIDSYSVFIKATKYIVLILTISVGFGIFLLAKSNISAARDAQGRISSIYGDRLFSSAKTDGYWADNTAFTLSASEGFKDPSNSQLYELHDVEIQTPVPNGSNTYVSSKIGRLDDGAELITLIGSVYILNSDEHEMRTEELVIDTTLGTVESFENIRLESSFGSISSGNMKISGLLDGPEIYTFGGGVSVTFFP